MAYCKRCGADIKWIKMQSGKWAPVNPARRLIRKDEGSDSVITERGNMVHGTLAPYSLGANDTGYVSHFLTCSATKKI